jgi:hypothetical protein
MADRAVSEGFLLPVNRDLLISDSDPERLLDRLSSYAVSTADNGIGRSAR